MYQGKKKFEYTLFDYRLFADDTQIYCKEIIFCNIWIKIFHGTAIINVARCMRVLLDQRISTLRVEYFSITKISEYFEYIIRQSPAAHVPFLIDFPWLLDPAALKRMFDLSYNKISQIKERGRTTYINPHAPGWHAQNGFHRTRKA